MSARLLLGRAPGDNALLGACPRVQRRVRAVVAMFAYGLAVGAVWYCALLIGVSR